MGGTSLSGYGYVQRNMRRYLAHRIAFELTFGPIPDGLFVCHHCDNPPCVNPAHLFVGTQAENMADMAAKGRHRSRGGQNGERHPQAKLTDAQVDTIRVLLTGPESTRQIAERYGVSRSLISKIQTGAVRPVAFCVSVLVLLGMAGPA
jgi:hypothetical protein